MVPTMAEETGQSGWTTSSAVVVKRVCLTVSVVTGESLTAHVTITQEMQLLSALMVRSTSLYNNISVTIMLLFIIL